MRYTMSGAAEKQPLPFVIVPTIIGFFLSWGLVCTMIWYGKTPTTQTVAALLGACTIFLCFFGGRVEKHTSPIGIVLSMLFLLLFMGFISSELRNATVVPAVVTLVGVVAFFMGLTFDLQQSPTTEDEGRYALLDCLIFAIGTVGGTLIGFIHMFILHYFPIL